MPTGILFGAQISLLVCHKLNMNAMEKITVEDHLNPHPRMRGPCGPQRDSPGAHAVIIGIPEPRVYLIIHYTKPLHCTTKFFHSVISMSHNALHYATAAAGSVRTPQTIAGDSLTMEWCLQFQHP